jgi:hypothetical protein
LELKRCTKEDDGIEGLASQYYQAHRIVKVTPKRVYIDVFPDSPGLEQVIVNRLTLEEKGEAWCPGQREIYYTRDRINKGHYKCPVVYRIKAVERRKEMKPIEQHIEQHKERVKQLYYEMALDYLCRIPGADWRSYLFRQIDLAHACRAREAAIRTRPPKRQYSLLAKVTLGKKRILQEVGRKLKQTLKP